MTELPTGRKQKVSVDDAVLQHLGQWTRPEGSGWVHTTLHMTERGAGRSMTPLVEVRVDGVAAGTLTPAMSKNYLPLIRLMDERDLVCGARAVLTGNRVRSELSIAACKASEVPQAWLDKHIYAVPVPPPHQGPDDLPADEPGSLAVGFHPDPRGEADLRMWDGEQWTSRIRMNPR